MTHRLTEQSSSGAPLDKPLINRLLSAETSEEPTSRDTQKRIVDYYTQTDESYQNWGNTGAYELHYGYFDSEPSGGSPGDDHAQALVRMNEFVADAAEIDASDHVLDAGCGVGASALWIAQNRGSRVHGISLAQGQVRKARHFADELCSQPQRIEFSVRDFSSTGFESGSFDVVWGLESICYAERKISFLREAHRLLRPGGRLVVADSFLTRTPRTEIEKYSLDRWLQGWSIPNLPTHRSFQNDLREAGFVDIDSEDITEAIRPSVEEIYRRGHEGYPSDILEKSKNVLQIQHVEACLFQKICLELGLWRYRVQTAHRAPA